MKIHIGVIACTQNNINYYQSKKTANTQVRNNSHNMYDVLTVAAYPMINFKAKAVSTDISLLLTQADKLLCAYSRRPMISPFKWRTIMAKLSKKTTAQSSINFLKEYRKYMLDVETKIFDMFEQYGASGQTNFQEILQEKRPKALENLKQKQREVLNSTNDYIHTFDENLAEELFYIRDVALLKITDGSFSRHKLLEQLGNLEVSKKDKAKVRDIYKMWYTLPRSYMDYDAFIVKYSGFSHEEIAQRMLNMSVATVEHTTAYSKGGKDKLENCALVCRLFNLDKDAMSLVDYDEYNPEIEIKKNISKYIDDVISETNRGNPFFVKNNDYANDFRQHIIDNTGWKIKTKNVVTPRETIQTGKLTSSRKGANRYRNYRR